MTTTTKSAKKLYKVFIAKSDDDTTYETATRLDIIVGYKPYRIDCSMHVNRKSLASAFKYFSKAVAQAVADGALDKKVAEFAYFADDVEDLPFDQYGYYTFADNIDNEFAGGIDDNGDDDYYFWFWAINKPAEIEALEDYVVTAEAQNIAVEAEEANAASNMTDIEKVIAERKTMTVRELFLEAKKEVGYNLNARGAKMWFISYPRYDINTEEYVGHTVPLKRTQKDVEIYLREEYCGMTLKTFLAEEKAWIDEETTKAINQMNIDDEAFHLRDKIIRESYACDDNDNVFNLLPTLDELNDVDESAIIVKEEIVNMYGKTFSFINIYGERVSFIDGEVHIISSDKYDAHFNRKTSKYVVAVIEDGNFKPITFDTDEEFFAEMAKRGACTIDEPEPPTVDDFDSKLAKLTAQRDEAQAALIKAQETHETAEQKLQDFLKSTAADLTTKLQSLKLDYRIKLVKTLDWTFDTSYTVNRFNNVHIEWYYVSYGVAFIVENGIDTPLARYDTPAQIEQVIDLLREAIARGDKEFIFPTIEELKPPKKFSGTLYKTNFNGRRHVFVGRARHDKGVMPMIVG